METKTLSNQQRRNLLKSAIIESLTSGLSLAVVCKLDGYPSYLTVVNWAHNDEVFSRALITARTTAGLQAADKAGDLANTLVDKMTDPDEVIDWKVLHPTMQHLRWMAERSAKESYGPQLEVKHSGTVNVRTSFLIPRTKQSVDEGEIIDLDASLEPAQLTGGADDEWMG